MSRLSRILLTLAAVAAFRQSSSAQRCHIVNVVGAPFTADVTNTYSKAGKTRVTTTHVARASNGSVYCAGYDSEGKLTGVEFDDVPGNRRTVLFVPRFPTDHNHTYSLLTPEDGFSTPSIEDVRQKLRRNQQRYAKDPDRENDLYHSHSIPLGEKSVDGMILFGLRVETTDEDGEKHAYETWESDLGLTMSYSILRPGELEETHSVLTNLRREEPDPSLFQIPKEYLSDPLLEAKTIFIDNQTGAPEILRGAVSQLDGWKKDRYVKPLAVVHERSAADLTATLARASVTDQGATTSGVRLQIYLREAQAPIFEAAERSSGSESGDEFAAFRCMEGLRNTVANTHVGQRRPPVAQTGFKPAGQD
jgi:hypothetical protein